LPPVRLDITTPTLPMLASALALALESRCADTAVVRNLIQNPDLDPS